MLALPIVCVVVVVVGSVVFVEKAAAAVVAVVVVVVRSVVAGSLSLVTSKGGVVLFARCFLVKEELVGCSVRFVPNVVEAGRIGGFLCGKVGPYRACLW